MGSPMPNGMPLGASNRARYCCTSYCTGRELQQLLRVESVGQSIALQLSDAFSRTPGCTHVVYRPPPDALAP